MVISKTLYGNLQLEKEKKKEFLNFTCQRLNTLYKRVMLSCKKNGNTEALRLATDAKNVLTKPIERLKYDLEKSRDGYESQTNAGITRNVKVFDSEWKGWADEEPNKDRVKEIKNELNSIINQHQIKPEKIRGFFADWENKINQKKTNRDLHEFVIAFEKKLNSIVQENSQEDFLKESDKLIDDSVKISIENIEEELEKKPNINTYLKEEERQYKQTIAELKDSWTNEWRGKQKEKKAKSAQEISHEITGFMIKLTTKIVSLRTAEFQNILHDHIESFKEAFTNIGKDINDIKNIIQDEDSLQLDHDNKPIRDHLGRQKRDNILKKLDCCIGDCRANKKGWGNWEEHMRKHMGMDATMTWRFVEFVREEIGYSGSDPSLDQQRQDFIEKRLRKLKGWDKLDSSEKENFENKIKNSNPNKFKAILQEAKQFIKNKGKNPPPTSGKDDAIKEIEKVIKELGLTEKELKWGNWRNDYFQSEEKINADKQKLLNNAYRKSAQNILISELSSRGLSIAILRIKNDDLAKHFERLDNKDKIEEEKQRLLQLIKTQRKDRIQEIEDNIKEIRKKLQEAGIGTKQEIEILGNTWENSYKHQRYETSEKITAIKKGIIETIDNFIAENSADNDAIIIEIKNILKNKGLEESILGDNWESKFKGKSQNERETEKNRLIGLIEKEIKRKQDSGEWSKEKAKKESKKLVAESIASAKKQIQNKLVKGHKKLMVKEEEIPAENLAPCKSLEEKLDSLKSTEEVARFENDLLVVIDNKKKEKLQVIINGAISEIEKEIGEKNDIQLGINNDFKKLLKGMVDPDKIEEYKNKLLNLIKEQKDISPLNNESKEPNLLKTVGVITLIALPLIIIIFIVLRNRQRKLIRRR